VRFYLASWIGDGTEGNEYRPNVDAESWAALDLRPDPSVMAGCAIVAMDTALVTLPRGVIDLGDDDLADRSVVRRDALRTALAVDLEADTIRGALAELLILHGTAPHDRTRWNRLEENRFGRHRIVMLGRVLFDAPAIVGAVITESFDTADSTTLGPDLTWTELNGDWEVVSNRARKVSGLGFCPVRADSDLDSDDHYVEAEVWGVSAAQIGVHARLTDASDWYAGFFRGLSDEWRIAKNVSGSFTSLAATSSPASVSGVLVRLEADGSALELFVDSVSTLSTTDTSHTGIVTAGFFGTTNGGDVDTFEAGDLTSTFTGTAAVTQADGTSTASGTHTAPTFTGTAAIVQDDQTATATGTRTTGVIVFSHTRTPIPTTGGAIPHTRTPTPYTPMGG
jgi:hypothetical protein